MRGHDAVPTSRTKGGGGDGGVHPRTHPPVPNSNRRSKPKPKPQSDPRMLDAVVFLPRPSPCGRVPPPPPVLLSAAPISVLGFRVSSGALRLLWGWRTGRQCPGSQKAHCCVQETGRQRIKGNSGLRGTKALHVPSAHATTEWARFGLCPDTCLIWCSFVSQSRF